MPIVAATQHAPFPPSGGNALTASISDVLSALDSPVVVSSGTTKYNGTILVSGSGLVNGSNQSIQLRGADAEGTVSASIRHFGPDIWGGNFNQSPGGPFGPQLNAWKFNCIRIGLNSSTWLNNTTYSGTPSVATYPTNDPYGIRTQLTQAIATANAAGMYVILVLGWDAPGRVSVGGQMPMASQDNAITFWKSVASYYGFPNGTQLKRNGGTVDDRSVLFELSNEPQCYIGAGSGCSIMMNGGFYGAAYYSYDAPGNGCLIYPYTVNAPTGTFTQGETVTSGAATGTLLSAYQCVEPDAQSFGQWTLHIYGGTGFNALAAGSTITGSTSGATAVTSNTVGWYIAGYSQIINSLRAAGVGNVLLLGSPNYNKDMSQWGNYAPTDSVAPAGWNAVSWGAWTPQIAATWHPYPHWGYISAVAVNNGGTGYVNGDTINLPMDESGGASSNSVLWQAQLTVTNAVGGVIQAGGVALNAITYGQPGGPNVGGNANFAPPGNKGGAYLWNLLPTNPVGQAGPGTGGSTSGAGTGANFNLTFTEVDGGVGGTRLANWPTVVTLENTFNGGLGVPIIITETGEHYGTAIVGSPWMSLMTSWCDTNNISLSVFNYNTASGWYQPNGGDLLLTTAVAPGVIPNYSGGYGQFMWNWFTTHAP